MNDFIPVSILNEYINQLFANDELLQNFWLKGEISGFRLYQQSGHMYFTLKDEDAAVSCVMFKSRAQRLKFKPEDGMEVLLRGSVSMYAKQGKVQVYAEDMQPFGQGEIFLFLEKLKQRLASEGCFDLDKKKPLPQWANRVGIVSSQDGAALRDILRVLQIRHPGVEVVLAHSAVQGAEAPAELARAIQDLNEYGKLDVIIVGRGGGSFEDLMAFNSEEVVYAIVNSKIPIISAVGHEVDVSLSDLAADLRAATPTQAAQFAVPDYQEMERKLKKLTERLVHNVNRNMATRSENLDRIMMKRVWREPQELLSRQSSSLQEKIQSLKIAMQDILNRREHSLALAAAGLDQLSPLKVMARGYAILSYNDQVVRTVEHLAVGDELKATLVDGELQLEIKGKEKGREWKQ